MCTVADVNNAAAAKAVSKFQNMSVVHAMNLAARTVTFRHLASRSITQMRPLCSKPETNHPWGAADAERDGTIHKNKAVIDQMLRADHTAEVLSGIMKQAELSARILTNKETKEFKVSLRWGNDKRCLDSCACKYPFGLLISLTNLILFHFIFHCFPFGFHTFSLFCIPQTSALPQMIDWLLFALTLAFAQTFICKFSDLKQNAVDAQQKRVNEIESKLSDYRVRPSALLPLWGSVAAIIGKTTPMLKCSINVPFWYHVCIVRSYDAGAISGTLGSEVSHACRIAFAKATVSHYNDHVRDLREGDIHIPELRSVQNTSIGFS
jgi:demethoxyubiquinone hydroxylase (CLK1/Coq7/Cat5 family)